MPKAINRMALMSALEMLSKVEGRRMRQNEVFLSSQCLQNEGLLTAEAAELRSKLTNCYTLYMYISETNHIALMAPCQPERLGASGITRQLPSTSLGRLNTRIRVVY